MRGVLRSLIVLVLACLILLTVAGYIVVRVPLTTLTRNVTTAPAVVAVYGSLWRGRLDLVGGYQLSWQSRLSATPLPQFATDFLLQGTDTRITGETTIGFLGAALRNGAGRAGPGLTQFVEGAWTCDMSANVRDLSARWGWTDTSAGGVITTPSGTCSKGQQEITLPPLALQLGQSGPDATMALFANQTELLAEATLRRARQFEVTIRPEAATVFPELPRSGPLQLAIPF